MIGQSVRQAATKLATRHIKKTLDSAIKPIEIEIKQYLVQAVGEDVPTALLNILDEEFDNVTGSLQPGIVGIFLEHVKIYQTTTGLKVDISQEAVQSLIQSIIDIPEIDEYFADIEIDSGVIQDIVIRNIKSVL